MPSITYLKDFPKDGELDKTIASIYGTETEYYEIEYVMPYTIHGSYRPATFDSEAEYPEVEYHTCDQITVFDEDGNGTTKPLTEAEERSLRIFTDEEEAEIEVLCFEDMERWNDFYD